MFGKRPNKLQRLVEQRKWGTVHDLIRSEPALLLKAGSGPGHTLPLHDAVRAGCPVALAKRMVRAAPAAVRRPDDLGRVPLHHVFLADRNTVEMSSGLVDFLLGCDDLPALEGDETVREEFELSAAARDVDGNIPLHLACGYGAPLNLVRSLVEFYPKGVWEENDKGTISSEFCGEKNQLVKKYFKETYPETENVARSRKAERIRPREEETLGEKILKFLPKNQSLAFGETDF